MKVLPRFHEPTEVVRTETQWKRVDHLAGNSETAGTSNYARRYGEKSRKACVRYAHT